MSSLNRLGIHYSPKQRQEEGYGGAALKAHTELVARHLDKDGKEIGRRVVKDRVVTNVFVKAIVDVLQGASGKFDLYKWHCYGSGTDAEAAADTALEHMIANTSALAGSQTQGGSSNIYKSVCTITSTGTHAITEHGLFDTSAPGIMMDRTLFAVINVTSGDKIEFTFQITFSSGG